MKRFFLAIGMVFLAGILFTSESPSLDGRALVADDGVFPKGLFAKTVGYLPGDSISVTNPAGSERIDILVIGSLDPSEGVAILLSPEAAQALNIKKNANNLVKLTKRSGAADEICNGSAVLTNDPSAVAEQEESKNIDWTAEEEIASDVPVEEAVAEAVEVGEENAADSEIDKAESEIAELEGNEGEPEEIAEIAAETEPEYPQYEEPVVDELAAVEEPERDEDFNEDSVIDEPLAFEAQEQSVVIEPEEVKDEDLDEFEAIVLVPSQAKAPEAERGADSNSSVQEPIAANVEPEPIASSLSDSKVSYINDYGELLSQKYYVQIAVYKSAENVSQIASKYGERYPITVVQQGSKNPVLVGPLTVDEYGAVLERFKSYGFKDAFVKVGTGSAKSRSYSGADIER